MLKKSQIGISSLSIHIRTYIYILVYTDQTRMFADIVRKPLYHVLLSTDTCPRTITSPDKPLLFTILPSHAFSTRVVSFCIYLNASLYASFTPRCIKQHRVKLDINSFKRQLSDGYRTQSYKFDKKPDPKETYRIPRILRN